MAFFEKNGGVFEGLVCNKGSKKGKIYFYEIRFLAQCVFLRAKP